jgi:hypothetical protein
MIVCDKCGKPVEYILNVDYLANKNFERIDLCEKHYLEVLELINTEPEYIKNIEENEKLTSTQRVLENTEKENVLPQTENNSNGELSIPRKRKRGRPPKKINPSI